MPNYGNYIDSLEDLRYGLRNDLVEPEDAFGTLVQYKANFQDKIAQQRADRREALMAAQAAAQKAQQGFISGLGEDVMGWAQDDMSLGALKSLVGAQSALQGYTRQQALGAPQIAGALDQLYPQQGPQAQGYASPAAFDQDDIELISKKVEASAQEYEQTRINVRAQVREMMERAYGPQAYVSFKATVDNVINQTWARARAEANLPLNPNDPNAAPPTGGSGAPTTGGGGGGTVY